MNTSALFDTMEETSSSAAFSLILERADLLKSLAHIQSVVERRNTIAILANVKLEASAGALRLSATDMDVAVVETISAQVEQEGATTVPAHTLYDIVRKLPDGAQVALKIIQAGRMDILCGQCQFSLSCLPVEEFPVMEEGDMSHRFVLPANDCRMLLDKTRFAISMEEARYNLNGIYLHAVQKEDGASLRAAATDGHRLARMEIALPNGAEGMQGVIIPRKTVVELRKLIEEGEGEVQIALSANKIRFSYNNITLLSKLIDGNFPDYERVIPTGNNKLMEVDAKLFTKAVDRVSTIAPEKSRGIKFALTQGRVTLSAAAEGNGTACEALAVNYENDDLETGFNFRYLLDVMAVLDGEVAEFLLADGTAPAVVRDAGNPGALYVVMPMRV